MGRVLKKDRHLQASIGQQVDVKLFKPVDGRKEYSGRLDGFDMDTVSIFEGDTIRSFKRAEIAVIRLAFDF